MPRKKGIVVDMLVEGSGGDLVFVPVEVKKKADIKKLLETKNSMIKENLKKSLELQKRET